MVLPLLVAALVAPTVRWAEFDLVPPERLPLGGYTERRGRLADGGGDVLKARAMALEDGAARVVLVSVDALTIPESLVREVRTRLPQDVGVFLAATHTHGAPDTQMLNDRMTMPIPGIATYRPRWLEWYADRIARSAQVALRRAGAGPVTLGTLLTHRVAANRSRRGLPHPPQTAAWLKIGPTSLFHYTAHPTLVEPEDNQPSGDWPGAVAARTGGMVLNGAIGDVSPVAAGSDSRAKIASMAQALTSGPWRSQAVSLQPIRFADVAIGLDPVSPHPAFGKEFGVPEALAETVVRRFAPADGRLTVVRLGDVAIVGVPGEPTSEIGRRIEAAGKAAGYRATWVVSHVGGWIGYVLGATDYGRGGYEAALSFHGPGTGDRVVAAASRALNSLR